MINLSKRKARIILRKARQEVNLYILGGFAIVQLVFILYVNFTKSYAFLDFDSSLAIRHGWEIWKNGIFLEDWSYFSTLEIDSASFFGTGLYVLTRNLNLSLGISHFACYLLMVIIIYDLLRNLSKENLWERTLFAVIFIFTPYSVGQLDWANMMFVSGGAYEFRVLLMFVLIDMFVLCDKKLHKSIKFYILIFLGGILNFWVSLSTGNYVLFMILVPIGLKLFWDVVENQVFRLWTPVNWLMLLNIFISFCGWRYRNHMVGVSHRNNLNLLAFNEIFTNLQNCIIGYFYLFRGLAEGPGVGLFTFGGILIIVRFCVALFCVLCTGYMILTKNKRKDDLCIKYVSCYIIVHFVLFLLVNTKYGTFWEYRYHILWCSLMLIFIADCIGTKKNFENKWLYNCVVSGLIIGLLLINAGGFKYCLKDYSDNGIVEKAVAIAEDLDVRAVYMCNMETNSHILRAKEPDIYCVNLKMEEEEGNPYISLIGNIYSYYSDNSIADKNNLLIATNEEFVRMPKYIRKAYSLLCEVEGEYNAYFSTINYWDGRSGLPAASVDVSIDFPFSNGYQYTGIINDEGMLVSGGGQSGIVLCSPDTSSSEGIYQISLKYGILASEKAESCYVEIVTDGGQTVLIKEYLSENSNEIVLSNIQIKKNMPIRVQLCKSNNTVIEIEKITYQRMNM